MANGFPPLGLGAWDLGLGIKKPLRHKEHEVTLRNNILVNPCPFGQAGSVFSV
jgi:hypothetical protein